MGPKKTKTFNTSILWKWLLICEGIIIVLGQVSWYLGLKGSTASELSTVNALSPIDGVFFSYLILNEIPQISQIIGGLFIVIEIAVSLTGAFRSKNKQVALETPPSFTSV